MSNFLGYSGLEPLVLSFGVLVIYVGGWMWFFTRIQGVRNEIALFNTTDRDVAHNGLHFPLAVMAGILIACSGVIILLSNTLDPFASPQGFQPIGRLDLASRAHANETLRQFTLDQPTKVGIDAVVQDINTTYFDLRLIGSDGFDAVILQGEDYTADQDRVLWNRELKPGPYEVIVTAHPTPGMLSVYRKDQ